MAFNPRIDDFECVCVCAMDECNQTEVKPEKVS